MSDEYPDARAAVVLAAVAYVTEPEGSDDLSQYYHELEEAVRLLLAAQRGVVVVTASTPPTETRLWFVLDPADRGPAYGPVLDVTYARRRAEATGGVLVFVVANVEYRAEDQL